MKVALVHNFHSSEVPSGENEVVAAEAAALKAAGVDVVVASVANDEMAERPLHVLRGAFTVATGIGISPLDLIDGSHVDVLHVHSLFPYLGSRWVTKATAPVVATLHSFRAVCANGYLFRDGEVCTLCPDGRRWSGVRYGCYRGSRLATAPLAWASRRGPAHDPLIAGAAALLTLSERAHTVFAAAGAPRDRLRRDWHFLPDALDPGPGGERDEAWLFVGRLTPEKGIDRLVVEWPDRVPLRVIGEGPLRPELEALAAGRPIELLGARPRDEVVQAMRRAFGLVFPSRWYETFGLAYLEALAAGLPTLALPPNVVADNVDADGTGVVGAWGAIADAVDEAHQRFDGLRDRCRAVFEERYTEQAFVQRRIRLYDELISGGSGPAARTPAIVQPRPGPGSSRTDR